MSDDKARTIHGRFLFTDGGRWHLPPLNTILMGTEDEIYTSDMSRSDFDDWWNKSCEIQGVDFSESRG